MIFGCYAMIYAVNSNHISTVVFTDVLFITSLRIDLTIFILPAPERLNWNINLYIPRIFLNFYITTRFS